MAGALPDLRMHDDRRFNADHREGRRRTGEDRELVVVGDQVVIPGVANVPLQLRAERTVIPKTVEAAIDFGGLEDKSAPPAKGDDLVHRLGHGGTWLSDWIVETVDRVPLAGALTRQCLASRPSGMGTGGPELPPVAPAKFS